MFVNRRWRQPWLSVAASVVLVGACNAAERGLGLEWSPNGASPIWLLAHATLMLGALWLPAQSWTAQVYAKPLAACGMITSVLAIVPLLIVAGGIPLDRTSGAALWLACIWLVFAWHSRQPIWFAAGQLMLTVAALFGLFFILDQYGDLSRSRSLDWQAAGLALAALSLGWTVARALLPGSSRWQELLRSVPRTVDQIVFLFVLVAQLVFIAMALAPHLARELQLGQSGLVQFSQARAWLLLILLAATLTLRLLQAHLTESLLAWIVVGVSCSVLPALAWQEANSVAAVARWGLASAFVVISTILWLRGRLAAVATSYGIAALQDAGGATPRLCRMLLLSLTVVSVLLLTVGISRRRSGSGQQP